MSNLTRKLNRLNRLQHKRARPSDHDYAPRDPLYFLPPGVTMAEARARLLKHVVVSDEPLPGLPNDEFGEFLAGVAREGRSESGAATARSRYGHIEGETPLDAYARGVGYSGPLMADKGLKDGSCNRTACQLPLKGEPQWTMPNYGQGGTDGKLYYCSACARKFHEADRQFGEPLRCTRER